MLGREPEGGMTAESSEPRAGSRGLGNGEKLAGGSGRLTGVNGRPWRATQGRPMVNQRGT